MNIFSSDDGAGRMAFLEERFSRMGVPADENACRRRWKKRVLPNGSPLGKTSVAAAGRSACSRMRPLWGKCLCRTLWKKRVLPYGSPLGKDYFTFTGKLTIVSLPVTDERA